MGRVMAIGCMMVCVSGAAPKLQSPPVAEDITITVAPGETVLIPYSGTDPDGDLFGFMPTSGLSNPSAGTLRTACVCSGTYFGEICFCTSFFVAAADFSGSVSFTYRAIDATGLQSADATVTINSTVQTRTAGQVLDEMEFVILRGTLPGGTIVPQLGNSLLQKISAARAALARGDLHAANGPIRALGNEVQGQLDVGISGSTGAMLLTLEAEFHMVKKAPCDFTIEIKSMYSSHDVTIPLPADNGISVYRRGVTVSSRGTGIAHNVHLILEGGNLKMMDRNSWKRRDFDYSEPVFSKTEITITHIPSADDACTAEWEYEGKGDGSVSVSGSSGLGGDYAAVSGGRVDAEGPSYKYEEAEVVKSRNDEDLEVSIGLALGPFSIGGNVPVTIASGSSVSRDVLGPDFGSTATNLLKFEIKTRVDAGAAVRIGSPQESASAQAGGILEHLLNVQGGCGGCKLIVKLSDFSATVEKTTSAGVETFTLKAPRTHPSPDKDIFKGGGGKWSDK